MISILTVKGTFIFQCKNFKLLKVALLFPGFYFNFVGDARV
jgi:hypothetical protein